MKALYGVGAIVVSMTIGSPATAKTPPTYYFCFVAGEYITDTAYPVNEEYLGAQRRKLGNDFWAFIKSRYPEVKGFSGHCQLATNLANAEGQRRGTFSMYKDSYKVVEWPRLSADKTTSATSGAEETTKGRTTPELAEPSAFQKKVTEDERALDRAKREADFQAKLAAHEAQVAEYQRKVRAREEEIARQQAQHTAAQQAAARELAAHEAKMAAHRRELDEANRRQQEYFAAQRRRSLCLTGDKKACDAIAAGKPALGYQAANHEASTDTDANRCVTTPEVRLNSTFQGNTSASVMNGCGKPVDIRICLKRNNDWNCGVTSAVASQKQAVYSSFEATGEVFVDARTTGSSRRFADPPS